MPHDGLRVEETEPQQPHLQTLVMSPGSLGFYIRELTA